MTRITVLGGTGYAGAAIAAEAAKRGHEVTVVSRTVPTDPIPEVDYVTGSVEEAAVLDQVVSGSDVVISALSPRGDMAGKVEDIVREVTTRMDGTGARFGYVGGASSLSAEPGGPRIWETSQHHMPDEVKPEVETGLTVLDELLASPETLDWFYVSPPEQFGSWIGAPVTGAYQLGGDVLLRGDDGTSVISAEDLALAILDEIETPAHRRARFTAISA